MPQKNILLKILFTAILYCNSISLKAQFTSNTTQTFNAAGSFIENIGQYGTTYKGQESMGNILYGFEGHNMPILFTKKGLIFLQRKVEKISKQEEEKLEKQGLSEEEIEHKKTVTDRAITMEWVGANENPTIIQAGKTTAYHTYGLLTAKAYGYTTLTYKNLYNGIDLIYHFTTQENNKIGFEYSLQVSAGADLSQIKMRYGGDVKKLKINNQGKLIVNSDIERIEQSVPISYYTAEPNKKQLKNAVIAEEPINHSTIKLTTTYKLTQNDITFTFPQNYDNTKPITIDPFISSTSNLDGLNAGKAKDVDFDYAGNVYVTGGGHITTNHRLAKYNAAGVLQWTFNGVLTTPSWQFGIFFGGWVVEKQAGNIYLGQGLNVTGFRVVRINTAGLYDNYITTANINFKENWKMIWNCKNGTAQILIAGGGDNSNINLGILIPPAVNISPINLTGIAYTGSAFPDGSAQDIVDVVIDGSNNKIYTLFASGVGTPSLNDKMYCNAPPYSGASIVWNTPSSFNTMVEVRNRPYLIPNSNGATDNSANIFSLNSNYLFYWDGKNLKAFNKATGAGVGAPLITSNTAKMTGGIYADGCNNVYVGATNGIIKVYNFNGAIFDDAPADITIAGNATKSVYDLAYNETDKLLYASGDGFVTSIDIAATCTNNNPAFTLNINPNCSTTSATATITPTPPTAAIVTYNLYVGSMLITTNNTGLFNNLQPQTNYSITAIINQGCAGIPVAGSFILPISALPTVSSTTLTYCQGVQATALIATGTNLLWYNGATGGTSTSNAPVPSTATAGSTTYYVSQTTAGNCESARVPITVQVNASPLAPLVNSPLYYCQGSIAIPLTATGTNLLWYNGAIGGTSSTTAPVPSTLNIGTSMYYVSQSNSSGCESLRTPITINITPPLVANAGNSITIALGTTTQLNATATAGADYTWTATITPITLSNIKILTPVANPTQTTTYLLTVRDVVSNCVPVTSSVEVIVQQKNCVNIRNAFTPNGDGKNDTWYVYDQDFCLAKDGASVQVFNRYGSKVYENKAYKNTWDGTYNGKPLPDGTYYAVIVFTFINGSKQNVRKDVTILR